MSRPLIAIVCYTDLNRLGNPSHILPIAYSRAIEMVGGIPYIIPFTKRSELLAPMMAHAGGCLFTGGIDIDPPRYQEPKRTCCCKSDADLDDYQFSALNTAIALGKPILGICRGAQVINVGFGGSLYQDVFTDLPGPVHKHLGKDCPGDDHMVHLEPGSRLYAMFGPTLMVNSRHHQSIKMLGKDLRVTARADDGVIEAAQHNTLPIDLIQWHPELMMDEPEPAMLPLFKSFVLRSA